MDHQSRVPERSANTTGGLLLLCFLDLLTAAEEACDKPRYRPICIILWGRTVPMFHDLAPLLAYKRSSNPRSISLV
jgi:hypothetical protein